MESTHHRTRINLCSQKLSSLPESLFQQKETLEILDLSDNEFTELPSRLSEFKNLKVLFCANNHFERLPSVLGEMSQLEIIGFKSNAISDLEAARLPESCRSLVLTNNKIPQLPKHFAKLKNLEKLMLTGNQLVSLPEELRQLKKLELLRLANNQFTQVPSWLGALPNLAWLALGGNPCSTTPRETTSPKIINWSELQLGELLGEGASGKIFLAQLRKDPPEKVAVKIFKPGVTSDGLPENELLVNLTVGTHHHLVSGDTLVTGHPSGAKVLLLPLIDSQLKNLAAPPSLESNTRDVYPMNFKLEEKLFFKILNANLQALRHLHTRGITHGDFYAHNILFSNDGEVQLGDFGASFFYREENRILEKIEVLAFGRLMRELFWRTTFSKPAYAKGVESILGRCENPIVKERPTFSELDQSPTS